VRRALCRAINTSGYFGYLVVSGGSKNERNHRHETRSNGFADRWDGDTHRIRTVQAAGGIVTDWTGQPAHAGGRIIAAATPKLHAAALRVISDAL